MIPESAKPNWIEESIIYVKCPRCKIGDLDVRVRRGILIKYMLMFSDVKRYRCSNCYAKVYAKTNIVKKPEKN